MSDTPRTDSEILGPYAEIEWCVDPDCARQLERELSAMTERADNLAVECQAAICERNERRAEVERLTWERDAAEVAYSREQESIKVLRSENCGLGQERDWLRAEVERLRDKYVPIEKVCAYIDGRLRCLHCETLLAEEKAEVERLRMQLVACGAVAMANTEESARKAREMHDEYRSASLADVCSAVDREMALRAEVVRLKALLWNIKTVEWFINTALRERIRTALEEE